MFELKILFAIINALFVSTISCTRKILHPLSKAITFDTIVPSILLFSSTSKVLPIKDFLDAPTILDNQAE